METGESDLEPGLFSGVSSCLAVVTIVLLICFVYKQFSDDESWEKYGVKSVKMGMRHFRDAFPELIKEHGDTVGVTRGGMILLTRDVKLLKQIMVKDFNNFTDRLSPIGTNSLISKGVFFLEGPDWRRVRQLMSPSFSTGKLKKVATAVDETARKLTRVVEECARRDQLVQVKHTTGQYTSEIIARTAFGLHTDCLGGDDDEFTFYSKKIFKVNNKIMSKIMLVLVRFRWLHKFLVQTLKIGLFDTISEDADHYLTSVLHKSIAERQKFEETGEKKPADFLQSLISAKATGDRMVVGAPSVQRTKLNAKTLTQDELIGQSLLVIFAAFETTSTTLQMCLYLLAKHPDIQERVVEEIETVVASDTPSHEELGQLKYMEQVINETLRLFPPVSVITRKAAETRTYGSITIPKDTLILIPIFLILKHPKHFPDPEKFDPERFSEENKAKRDPIAFTSFGYGPRLCIGMRLAYLELKIALVHLLRKIKFELNDRTVPKKGEEVPKLKEQSLLVFESPIQLAASLRNP